MLNIKHLLCAITFLSASSLHSMEQIDYPETDDGFVDLSQLSGNSMHRSSPALPSIEDDISPSLSPWCTPPKATAMPSPKTIATLAQAAALPLLLCATQPSLSIRIINSPSSPQASVTNACASTPAGQITPQLPLAMPTPRRYVLSNHVLHPIFAQIQTDPEIMQTRNDASLVQRHSPPQSTISQPMSIKDNNNGKEKHKKKCCLCCIL